MPTPVSECLYCQNNETLHNLMIKICDLEVSQLFIFKEQSHPGRCNVVYKEHAIDLHDLTDDQRNAFMGDVARAGKAIAEAFSPDKINYGSYGDKLSHLHFHHCTKIQRRIWFWRSFRDEPSESNSVRF
jgi:diadenosine tetraphosphate (Ap4A) HIT family hydrolase